MFRNNRPVDNAIVGQSELVCIRRVYSLIPCAVVCTLAFNSFQTSNHPTISCKFYFWFVGMIQWGTFFSGNSTCSPTALQCCLRPWLLVTISYIKIMSRIALGRSLCVAHIFLSAAILTLRVVALYGNKPIVRNSLFAFLLITWSLAFAFTANSLYLLACMFLFLLPNVRQCPNVQRKHIIPWTFIFVRQPR